MNIIKIINHLIEKYLFKNKFYIVSFSGGLGNQIISFFVYKYLVDMGKEVIADTSYFFSNDIKSYLEKKGITHYKWELDRYFDFQLKNNRKIIQNLGNKFFMIKDGYLKFYIALKASKEKIFIKNLNNKYKQYMPIDLINKKYLCIHFRQGDFLKVASLIPSIYDLIFCASKFQSVCNKLVLLSDGFIDPQVKKILKDYGFKKIIIMNSNNPLEAHSIMVNSNVLICSNSQFSFSAGLLNKNLVIIPKRWFSGIRNYLLEKLINENSSNFQVY